MSNRDSCFDPRTHTHDSQVSGDPRSQMLPRRACASIHALPVRWRTKTLWRAGGAPEFDRSLGRSGFVLTVCAGSPSRSRVRFPFFRLISGEGRRGWAGLVRARNTPQLLGWLAKKMAARVDGGTVQLSGHPERRKPTRRGSGARRRRTNPAGARLEPWRRG